ncbi:hypothetical protein Tco_1116673 [Tanacetum coccineum]
MFFSSATWDERLEIVEVKVSSFDAISYRSLVTLDGSSFSSVGKQLAKSCKAKSLAISGFREVTRRVVSWLMSGYEGLAFSDAASASAAAFCVPALSYETKVARGCLAFSASSSLLSSETIIGSSVGESGVKKADLVSFKISVKSSSFYFRGDGHQLLSSFATLKLRVQMKEVDQAGSIIGNADIPLLS